jgi:hypothetical protein
MTILKRLPVYAAGVGLAGAVVAVAAARNWSGLETLLVALGVAVFYVVTILVPWLIREQVGRGRPGTRPGLGGSSGNGGPLTPSFRIEISSTGNAIFIPLGRSPWTWPQAETHGPRVVEPSELHAVAR